MNEDETDCPRLVARVWPDCDFIERIKMLQNQLLRGKGHAFDDWVVESGIRSMEHPVARHEFVASICLFPGLSRSVIVGGR